ncbi:MAG: transcription antitermination factor NusB [Gemmatimonadetes bacterium]|jgi:N utilization substance protein B|nr:transcription antitermination factor NusB [Gemmatimonadota bacterium]MBA3968925.1 transcription antitermination factor NusB [Gemmatimonadota bacterium]MDQ3310343.1 transcription antitermination factor NusB [Gemmatimonadota bacterium]
MQTPKVHERSRARGWALQALYSWEMRGAEADSLVQTLEDVMDQLQVARRNASYSVVLVRLIAANLPRVDRVLTDALENWRMDRLAVMDRNILRIGVTEILFVDDVPPLIAVREGAALAERYGTPESPRFVRGVLDAVARNVAAPRP